MNFIYVQRTLCLSLSLLSVFQLNCSESSSSSQSIFVQNAPDSCYICKKEHGSQPQLITLNCGHKAHVACFVPYITGLLSTLQSNLPAVQQSFIQSSADNCYICTDELGSEPEVITLTCGHKTHRGCLTPYIKRAMLLSDESHVDCGICRNPSNCSDLAMNVAPNLEDMLAVLIEPMQAITNQLVLSCITVALDKVLKDPRCNQNLVAMFGFSEQAAEAVHQELAAQLPLSLEKVTSGEYQNRLRELFPQVTKEHIHEFVYAALRYFEITSETVDGFLMGMANVHGPAVGSIVSYVSPYARVLKLMIQSDDRTKELSSTNPLVNFVSTIPKDRLIRMVTRGIISHIMDLNEESGAALTQTPHYVRFGFYMLYIGVYLYFGNGESCYQFLQSAATTLLPLQFSPERIDDTIDAFIPLVAERTRAQLMLTAAQVLNLHPNMRVQITDVQTQERRFLSELQFDARSAGLVVSGIICALIIQQLISLVG